MWRFYDEFWVEKIVAISEIILIVPYEVCLDVLYRKVEGK